MNIHLIRSARSSAFFVGFTTKPFFALLDFTTQPLANMVDLAAKQFTMMSKLALKFLDSGHPQLSMKNCWPAAKSNRYTFS
jgi:hypothetical protein